MGRFFSRTAFTRFRCFSWVMCVFLGGSGAESVSVCRSLKGCEWAKKKEWRERINSPQVEWTMWTLLLHYSRGYFFTYLSLFWTVMNYKNMWIWPFREFSPFQFIATAVLFIQFLSNSGVRWILRSDRAILQCWSGAINTVSKFVFFYTWNKNSTTYVSPPPTTFFSSQKYKVFIEWDVQLLCGLLLWTSASVYVRVHCRAR